jgi:hypothetical protein
MAGDSLERLWFSPRRSAIFRALAPRRLEPETKGACNEETDDMRRFLLIVAAASIALVGLSANQCGGGEEKAAEPAKPAEEMPAKPDDSMAEPPAETPAE